MDRFNDYSNDSDCTNTYRSSFFQNDGDEDCHVCEACLLKENS